MKLNRRKPIVKNEPKKVYSKPVSLYPLKWWEAMGAFMQIKPKTARKIREEAKK